MDEYEARRTLALRSVANEHAQQRDMRKPRKILFYVNGDKFFRGKKIYITPNRYLHFAELLADVTEKIPRNVGPPYGVRKIFTPRRGTRVRSLDGLQDGGTYVCAGFEPFVPCPYGKNELEPWSNGRSPMRRNPSQSTDTFTSRPLRPLRQSLPGERLRDARPRIVTVAHTTGHVKILLNRRSVQTFEQLFRDVCGALGSNGRHVVSLYSLDGRPVSCTADFFRDDDSVFVATGRQALTRGQLNTILCRLYPDSDLPKAITRSWKKANLIRTKFDDDKPYDDEAVVKQDTKDSGLSSDAENEAPTVPPQLPRARAARPLGRLPSQQISRIENQRQQFRQWERDRERRRQKAQLATVTANAKRYSVLAPIGSETPRTTTYRFRATNNSRHSYTLRLSGNEHTPRSSLRDSNVSRASGQTSVRQNGSILPPIGGPKARPYRISPRLAQPSNEDEDGNSGDVALDLNDVIREEDEIETTEKSVNSDVSRKSPRKSSPIRKSKLERQISRVQHVESVYRPGKQLGDGNFAVVRQCTRTKTNDVFAMKVIDKSKLKGKEQMVEQEIDILKCCDHPNIVKLYEEYETKDNIYLIMELVQVDHIIQSFSFFLYARNYLLN